MGVFARRTSRLTLYFRAEPADESRAPELWINSSRWLKVERLIAIHANIVKEMQLNLHEMSAEQTEDNWLETNNADMERISALIQEDLVKPTANLADLMYKSVGKSSSLSSTDI